MLDPILTPSIPHSTLYLPPELVGQILQDSSLSKSDLARCCLINYDFLYGARPLLYAELRVCITWAVVTGWWVLDRGNELLFQTLSETPSLGQYARKASLFTTSIDEEGTGVYNGPTYNDFGKPVKQALEIMPRLESLKLSEYIFSALRPPTFSRFFLTSCPSDDTLEMPSSPAFPSHHCHTLPNELIDQILSDKTLSKLDLSNCTRVNRQFLPFALQHLYKTVALEIDQFGNFYDPGRIKWSYSDSGNSLVSILERSAKHQHLITKVVVYLGRIKDISVRVGYVSRRPDAAIRHLLSLVPNVKSVTFPQDWNELPMVRTVIYDEGSRFEELDIGGDIELGELESWSKLPKLRKLKCHSLQSRNNSETVNILPNSKS
ncbi:hypothetical protein JCM5353_001705 [Sporobolomyces roseus]